MCEERDKLETTSFLNSIANDHLIFTHTRADQKPFRKKVSRLKKTFALESTVNGLPAKERLEESETEYILTRSGMIQPGEVGGGLAEEGVGMNFVILLKKNMGRYAESDEYEMQ